MTTKRGNRKQEILQTLAEQLEKNPGEPIRTAGLAKAAGISEAALYRHFPSKAKMFEADPEIQKLGTCMVKTHLSLSHDPDIKGRPKGWELPISDILIYKGAGFIVPVAGAIKLMPGTGSDPSFRGIDVDVETGKIEGLF